MRGATAVRPRPPATRWADLPRSMRVRAFMRAWWKGHVARLVCRARGHRWEFTTEYRTNRVMRDWQTCPRCWAVRATPADVPRRLTAR